MNISLIRTGIPNLLPMLDRSPGVHVSEIIKDICIITGRYQADYELDMSKAQLGCCLEFALAQRYSLDQPTRYVFGVELFLDNIYGTSDIIDLVDFVVEECKLTWISVKRELVNSISYEIGQTTITILSSFDIMFWQFIVQLMAYCKMLGTRIGRLHLCHINGFIVIYNVWEIEFEQEELDDVWEMLTGHRDRMIAEGRL